LTRVWFPPELGEALSERNGLAAGSRVVLPSAGNASGGCRVDGQRVRFDGFRARLPALALVLVATTVLASPALGQTYLFRTQGQALLLGSLGTFGDQFGGIEAQANVSWVSIGLAGGLGYELLRLPRSGPGARTAGGVRANLALQWRFLALVDGRLVRYIDPHADLGFLLGLLSDRGARFRGAVYTGGSLDLGLPLDGIFAISSGLVATVQYRYFAKQTPGDARIHELLVGLGIRIVLSD